MHAGALRFLVVGAAFVAGPAGFTAEPVAPVAPPAAPLVRGCAKSVIAAHYGMPSQIVTPELWVYREFHSDRHDAARRGFDTLVIVFKDDRVVQARLVNGEALTAVLEARREAQAQALALAAPPRTAGR